MRIGVPISSEATCDTLINTIIPNTIPYLYHSSIFTLITFKLSFGPHEKYCECELNATTHGITTYKANKFPTTYITAIFF